MKRTIEDIHLFEIDAPEGMSDAEIIEAFNVGEIDGHEFDGRIELEPVS
jgi:hypothetical protein